MKTETEPKTLHELNTVEIARIWETIEKTDRIVLELAERLIRAEASIRALGGELKDDLDLVELDGPLEQGRESFPEDW